MKYEEAVVGMKVKVIIPYGGMKKGEIGVVTKLDNGFLNVKTKGYVMKGTNTNRFEKYFKIDWKQIIK